MSVGVVICRTTNRGYDAPQKGYFKIQRNYADLLGGKVLIRHHALVVHRFCMSRLSSLIEVNASENSCYGFEINPTVSKTLAGNKGITSIGLGYK